MVGGGTDEVEDGGDNDNKGYHNGYDGISLVRITILVGSSEIVDNIASDGYRLSSNTQSDLRFRINSSPWL